MSELKVKYFAVLGDIENPTKDRTADAGRFSYKYADLAQVLDIVKDATSKHGITAFQWVDLLDGVSYLNTSISDGAEDMTLASFRMPESVNAQDMGSWITYMRRYQLMIVFGLAAEDDDGKSAKNLVNSELEKAQARLIDAEKRFCESNGIDDWKLFHKQSIMTRKDYANDVNAITMIAQELIDES